jgi:hypothetical protein
VLTGSWIVRDGRIRADSVCDRIEWLISRELQMVANSPEWGGWETLYKDPNDGRYWERTYPQGDLHGGGPPQLRLITPEQATKKYQTG